MCKHSIKDFRGAIYYWCSQDEEEQCEEESEDSPKF